MKARKVKKLDPERSLAENAARIVAARLDELRSFVPRALEPDGVSEQHDMRIAAKRLRYVLEVTGFCFGRAAVTARRRARELQDMLGEMHDCDVMLPRVRAHLDELRAEDARTLRERAGDAADLDPGLARSARNRTAYRGLEVLIVYLEARRGHLFERFREFWAEHERRGTWDRLERTSEKRLELARQRRRAAREADRARQELERAAASEREARERAERAQAELERTG
jgi:hypothetical protein